MQPQHVHALPLLQSERKGWGRRMCFAAESRGGDLNMPSHPPVSRRARGPPGRSVRTPQQQHGRYQREQSPRMHDPNHALIFERQKNPHQ